MSADILNSDPGAETAGKPGWEFRRVLRNASYLTMAQVATRLAGFAYVLVLARWLPASQFGLLTLVLSVLLIADMIADLGLSRLALRDLSRDFSPAEAIMGRLMPLKLLMSGLIYVGLVTAASVLSGAREFVGLLALAGLSLLPSGLAAILESVLQADHRFGAASMARGVLSLGQVGLGIGVLLAGGGAVAVAATFAVAYTGFLAALAFALARADLRLRFRVDAPFWRRSLLTALPFAVVGVVFALTVRVDLLVLGWASDPASVALYGMAIKVVEAALLATIALGTALTPLFSRYYATAHDKLVALYLRALRFVLIATFPASLLALTIGPPILKLILPRAYDGVDPLLHVMFAGFPFWVGYFLNASLLLGTDRQYGATAVLVGLVSVQGVISLLIVTRLGATGAALAFSISGLLSFIGTTAYVERLLALRWSLLRTTLGPLCGGIAALGMSALERPWGLAAGLALFALVVLGEQALRLRVFTPRPMA